MLQTVPHQIVQSPAMLGLSNPNSPALQTPGPPKLSSSQNPPTHQQPQPTSLSSIKTTSSTLLPLLSPLPRAQALLLQMASLASKLFDASPNRSLWLSSFRGSLPTFLPAQVISMNPPSIESTPSSTKDILATFSSLQMQLFEAVAELQEILDLQAANQKLAAEIRSNDSAILAFANKLKQAVRVLDMVVDDYADYRGPKRSRSEDGAEGSPCTTTIASHLNLSDIISYAHKISYTTFAPPEYGAGQAPLRGALPPAPQEEQMRASQLYNFANLDVGLLPAAEDKGKAIDPLMEVLPTPSSDGNSFAELGLQGLIPPPGWKPGMPVELPRGVPLPPPGWKPGDPVPLPPLGSFAVPAPRPEHQMPQPVPSFMPRAHEPIMVQPVQLDILDGSSDDSSDEGDDVDDGSVDDED